MGPSWVNTTRAALECRRFASKVLFLSGAAETEICVASLPQGCRKVDVRSDSFFASKARAGPNRKVAHALRSAWVCPHASFKAAKILKGPRGCVLKFQPDLVCPGCGDVEQFTRESRKTASTAKLRINRTRRSSHDLASSSFA